MRGGLGLVSGIQQGTYAGHEREAALIMAHLVALPAIRDHGRRRLYGNEILQNADEIDRRYQEREMTAAKYRFSFCSSVLLPQQFGVAR